MQKLLLGRHANSFTPKALGDALEFAVGDASQFQLLDAILVLPASHHIPSTAVKRCLLDLANTEHVFEKTEDANSKNQIDSIHQLTAHPCFQRIPVAQRTDILLQAQSKTELPSVQEALE